MVGVAGVIALLNLAQKAAQLALVQGEVLDVAGLLEEVEGQQGQSVAWRGLSQPEDVILPRPLCTLSTTTELTKDHNIPCRGHLQLLSRCKCSEDENGL